MAVGGGGAIDKQQPYQIGGLHYVEYGNES